MGKAQRLKAERAAEKARAESIAAARGRGSGGGRSLPVFWIVLGLIMAIAVLVLVVTSGGGSKSSSNAGQRAFSTISTTGASLSRYTGSGTDSAIGKDAPIIKGTDVNKNPISIGGPSDKPTMVLFVAHWCPHCQAEIPRLTAYLKQHGGVPTNVRLATVATSSSTSRPNYPPAAWLTREKWPVPALLDDEVSSALGAYGAGGFPFFVELDKNGKVVMRMSGEIATSEFGADLKSLAATK